MGDLSHVAVLTVNYRSHHLLRRNLAQLSAQAPELAVVVYDNFTDGTERAAVSDLARDKGWTFVASPDNGGFAKGTNAAARAALQAGGIPPAAEPRRQRRRGLRVRAGRCGAGRSEHPGGAPALRRHGTGEGPRTAAASGRRHDDASAQQDAGGGVAGARRVADRRLSHGERPAGAAWTDWPRSTSCIWGRRRVLLPGGRQGRSAADRAGSALRARPRRQPAVGSGIRPSFARKTPMYFYFSARNRLLFASRNLGPAQQRAWEASSRRVAWATLRQARGRRRALLQSQKALVSTSRGLREGRRFVSQAR